MGDLSANFSRWEFACGCGCGFDTVDAELLNVAQDVREHFDSSVTITGPNRCAEHNAATPGASVNSMHTKARAIDFKIKGVHADKVADYLEAKYPDRYGIGRYTGRTHVDTRATRARWDKRGSA